MLSQLIQESVRDTIRFYTENPGEAIIDDIAATACVEEGLHCRVTGANGEDLLSDMPEEVGGGNTAPSPGWLLRAALAASAATVIAMRAAEVGITLTGLEVRVGSTSDDRGMLDIDDSIHPGPLNIHVQIKIGAERATEEQLHELVMWSEKHSPVGDAIFRSVPLRRRVEVV